MCSVIATRKKRRSNRKRTLLRQNVNMGHPKTSLFTKVKPRKSCITSFTRHFICQTTTKPPPPTIPRRHRTKTRVVRVLSLALVGTTWSCLSPRYFINVAFQVNSGAALVFDMPETLFEPNDVSHGVFLSRTLWCFWSYSEIKDCELPQAAWQ